MTLSGFVITNNGLYDPLKPIPISETMDMFTFFVVIMLGTIMTKMNQWAVQAASQLSEGSITFSNTMASKNQMVGDLTKKFGDTLRGNPGGGGGKGGGK